jgi:hypothetical protein
MDAKGRAGYAEDLKTLQDELGKMAIPDRRAVETTVACIGSALKELSAIKRAEHT